MREKALRAVHAQQTMLTRMVLFNCDWCNERFPTFHPAYRPPLEVELELTRPGKDGVALCNIEVAKWGTLPPLEEPAEELAVAKVYCGTCLACDRDMQQQREAAGVETPDGEVAIVPKRSTRSLTFRRTSCAPSSTGRVWWSRCWRRWSTCRCLS